MMQVDGFDSAIRTMASTDDKGFWIGLFNGELVRMEIRDNRWVRAGNFNLNLPNGQGIRDLVLTPDGRGFGLVTTDGVVRVGQTDNPGKTTIPKDGLGEFTCIAFGPEGDLVAGGDQLVRWRDTAEEPTRPWSKNYITSVAFDLAGKFRAAGTRTGPILLWEGSDTVPRLLNGHASPVHTLSFSADGKMLASGSADRSIRLWLLDNPKARPLEYTGHQSWVWQVVFSPDGARIYSAGHDRTVRSWPVPVEELAERVCTLVRPELTREEWDLHVSPQLRHEQTCPTSPAENQPGGPQPYRP
ncbi:MAG: hypothetical protein QNK37_03470 [Acidobacteriota bacterium]|nr:hypothetical protein [Acidobacteriota bacterium]